MTDDTTPENLQKKFAKKTQTNLESLEDWMLAGLVIWQDVNDAQKKWIIEKLSRDPSEMFLKHWENYRIPTSSLTGFKEIRDPHIQSSIMAAGCRGRHQWPNKLMKKGDLRLSIKVPNPNDPYYGDRVNWVKHFFCANCSSKYIDFKEQYAPIKEWWNRSLKLEKEQIEEQIKKQKAEEKEKTRKIEAKKAEKKKAEKLGPVIYLADKIVKSEWGGASGNKLTMKKIAASLKKGEVSSEILEEVLWTYMFHGDSDTRAAAKKTFMEMAPEDAKETVKKNWKASSRNSKELTNHLAKLGKNLSHTKINFTNLLIKVLEDYKDPPHYLLKQSGYKDEIYPAIEALDIIGDAQAAGPLGQFMTTSLGVRWSDWKVEAMPTIISSLVKFGEPAIVPLVETLKCASDSKVGLEDKEWYIGGKQISDKDHFLIKGHKGYVDYCPSTRIIANALTKLKWKPETDELLALQLVAMQKWSDCVKLGVPTVEPLIKVFEHNWDSEERQNIAKTLGEIGDARAVRAMTSKDWGDWWSEDYVIKALGNIDDVSVISALLKALEEINERTPSGSKRGYAGERFSIEELGMTEYYTNGLLKEIPSKPTFRKKYKIYGAWAKEASAAIIKILPKFEKNIMKNYTNDDTDLESLLMGEPIKRKWVVVILQKIADKNLKSDEKKNVLKFLKSDDQGMIMMGASMLKGILKE